MADSVSILLLNNNGLDNITHVVQTVLSVYRNVLHAVSFSSNSFPSLPTDAFCVNDGLACDILETNRSCLRSLLYLGLRNMSLSVISPSAFGGISVGGCGLGTGVLDMEGSRIGAIMPNALYRSSRRAGSTAFFADEIDSVSLQNAEINTLYANAFGSRTLYGHFNVSRLPFLSPVLLFSHTELFTSVRQFDYSQTEYLWQHHL